MGRNQIRVGFGLFVIIAVIIGILFVTVIISGIRVARESAIQSRNMMTMEDAIQDAQHKNVQ